MDFRHVVEKYGEATTKVALVMLVRKIRELINLRVESAINGILVVSIDDLRNDVNTVSQVLNDSPFSMEEKCILVRKAWEIVSP